MKGKLEIKLNIFDVENDFLRLLSILLLLKFLFYICYLIILIINIKNLIIIFWIL